jgi:type IV secretion system protein VirB1
MLAAAEIVALALACAPSVEVGTAQAIIRRESGGNPYAIGVVGAKLSHQPRTKEQALYVANVLKDAALEFDVGIAQIRTTNLTKLGVSIEQALDPCQNMQLMQFLLVEAHQRAQRQGYKGAGASIAAVSAYNTGNFVRGLQNGYVGNVIAAHPRNAAGQHLPQRN